MNTTNQNLEILKEFLEYFEQRVEIEKKQHRHNYSLCKLNYKLAQTNLWNRNSSIIIAFIIRDNKPKRFSTEFKSTNAYYLGYYWPIDEIEPRRRWIKRMIIKYSKN